MTSSKLDEYLAQKGIRSCRGDNFALEDHNNTTTDKMQHFSSRYPQPDVALDLASTAPSKITAKHLKVIHATIQMKIVRDFDPHNHSIDHLPWDFFLNLSTADLEQAAWRFINPDTAAAAIIAMPGKIKANEPIYFNAVSSTFIENFVKEPHKIPGKFTNNEGCPAKPNCEYDEEHRSRTEHLVRQFETQDYLAHASGQSNEFGMEDTLSSCFAEFSHGKPSWGPMLSIARQDSGVMVQSPIPRYPAMFSSNMTNMLPYSQTNIPLPTVAQHSEVPRMGSVNNSSMVLCQTGPIPKAIEQTPLGMGTAPVYASSFQVFAPLRSGMKSHGVGCPAPPSAISPNHLGKFMGMNKEADLCPSPPRTVSHLIRFNPSRFRQGISNVNSHETLQRAHRVNLELNPNYKGCVGSFAFRNANCPPELNCSVHVAGFYPFTSQKEMLSLVRFARVAALCRHEPILPKHPTAAAYYTFFDRESAERFMWLGRQGMLSIHGCCLSFKWNVNRVCPSSAEELQQSRNLLIEGPDDMITWDQVIRVLKDHLTFELVDGEEQYVGEDRNLFRFEFSQIRGQSRPGKRCILAYINANGIRNATVDYEI